MLLDCVTKNSVTETILMSETIKWKSGFTFIGNRNSLSNTGRSHVTTLSLQVTQALDIMNLLLKDT